MLKFKMAFHTAFVNKFCIATSAIKHESWHRMDF